MSGRITVVVRQDMTRPPGERRMRRARCCASAPTPVLGTSGIPAWLAVIVARLRRLR
ncbi:MAG: hypothetical protein JW910_01645 [Anaerolineae bacterium]|nr:hypothetical protein [Anaerolineae bacterium]